MVNFSVIVAAQDAGSNLRGCLTSLAAQQQPGEMEVLVVEGSGREGFSAIMEEFPAFRFLHRPAPISVPRLWREGIAASQGKIVALTIENCVPARDWVRQMRVAHAADCSAVGGAIDMDARGSLVDWAVYFCRYSSYMPPFSPRFLDDLAGDNCSYKREALAPVLHEANDGFWETFIHREMRRRGERLLADPAPVVTYCGGLRGWRFFRRRYLHGRYFAARRGRDFTTSQRLVRATAFLAVAALLFKRIAGRVWRHGRHRAKLALALPLILGFLLAWSAGECAGYLRGPVAATPPERE